MLVLRDWKTPASFYPEASLGNARIKTLRYRGIYAAYGLRGHHYYRAINLPVRTLAIDGKTWMVDDPPHWWAMQNHATFYHGHVLVAGLGLGLIVHTLHANPEVEKITVIEREKDVIGLISPLLPRGKVKIEHGDFWDWSGRVDGVFFDLFVGGGHALFLEALRTYVQLLEQFPRPIRIHGFNNDNFDKLGEEISAGRPRVDGRRLLRDNSHGGLSASGKRLRGDS
jgi:hypothetical protein